MTRYGYVAYTFRVHQYGSKELLPLGQTDGHHDAAIVLYGALRGLEDKGIQAGNRYLRTNSASGMGRTVRFKVDIGQSGASSTFVDPADDDRIVFRRTSRHVETNTRRGLLVVPTQSQVGLLILEVQGRSGAKTILCPALKRAFRKHTDLILDFSVMVDEAALQHYLTQAALREITLRRTGLPSDIADIVDIGATEADAGHLELRISPGGLRQFASSLVNKLRGDQGARRTLLHVGNLEFSDLSVTMEVGKRQRTLTITSDRIPSFVYDLPYEAAATDDGFYAEVLASVEEIAQAVGMTVGGGWETGKWSADALATVVEVPTEEASDERFDSSSG